MFNNIIHKSSSDFTENSLDESHTPVMYRTKCTKFKIETEADGAKN